MIEFNKCTDCLIKTTPIVIRPRVEGKNDYKTVGEMCPKCKKYEMFV